MFNVSLNGSDEFILIKGSVYQEIHFDFKTKIQSPTGELLSPYLVKRECGSYQYLLVNDSEGPVILGDLSLSAQDNHGQYSDNCRTVLWISGIANYSHLKPENQQYKNVGLALMEYVLAQSLDHDGCIALEAVLSSRVFFEKCFFKVHHKVTEAMDPGPVAAVRDRWFMYLPLENLALLKEKLKKETVLRRFPTYYLLNATEIKRNLILENGGQILSGQDLNTLEPVCFSLNSILLRTDNPENICDKLGLYRNEYQIPSSLLSLMVGSLKLQLPECTIEITPFINENTTSLFITANLSHQFLVASLCKAATAEQIMAWRVNLCKQLASQQTLLPALEVHLNHQTIDFPGVDNSVEQQNDSQKRQKLL